MKRTLIALIMASMIALPSAQAADPLDESCWRVKINEERAEVGQKALRRNARIERIAQRHSEQMARDGTIYHNNNLAAEYGSYEEGGENVGMGPDCQSIHDAFMSSPGHRANILDPEYKEIGVGVAITYYRDSSGNTKVDTVYVTEDFYTAKVNRKPSTPSRCT